MKILLVPQSLSTFSRLTYSANRGKIYLSVLRHRLVSVTAAQNPYQEANNVNVKKYIAAAMGVKGTENMTIEEYRKAAIDAVRQLSEDVGIPKDLKEIVKPEDIPFLAQSAYDDACRPGNPKETSVEDLANLYRSLL